MAKYHLFMYHDDESATILNTPVHTIEADKPPTELTHDMFAHIVCGLLSSVDPQTIEQCLAKTDDQLAEILSEDLCLYMTSIGIVPNNKRVLTKLKKGGEALMDTFGDDSACYQAAASFVQMVQLVEIGRLDVPQWSED